MITDYGLGSCRTLLLVYYPFGRGPVAPYPFVDILTGTLQVSGSTQEWHGRAANMKTLVHAFEFWGNEVRLMKEP